MKRRSFLATLGLSALFGKEVVKAATQPKPSTALERERAISALYRQHGVPADMRDLEPIGAWDDTFLVSGVNAPFPNYGNYTHRNQ
jgi:hypothetical protein